MEDLLLIAKENSIKESWARNTIQSITEVVSDFENRAKKLNINNELVSLVTKNLRLNI